MKYLISFHAPQYTLYYNLETSCKFSFATTFLNIILMKAKSCQNERYFLSTILMFSSIKRKEENTWKILRFNISNIQNYLDNNLLINLLTSSLPFPWNKSFDWYWMFSKSFAVKITRKFLGIDRKKKTASNFYDWKALKINFLKHEK